MDLKRPKVGSWEERHTFPSAPIFKSCVCVCYFAYIYVGSPYVAMQQEGYNDDVGGPSVYVLLSG